MKKFFLTVLFLFFLIVGGLAFFIVRSFNTDTFQKQIVHNISQMTGREFNVMGATYVTWFPTPQIVMNDVTLANVKGSQRAVMLRANRIGVELEWASLLKEPLVIKKIDVENPTLFLERTDATHVNWDFPFLFESGASINDFGVASSRTQTRVDALSVRGGTIEYTNNLNQVKWLINNVNGNLAVETLQGPYAFNGTFRTQEKTVSAELKVTQMRTDAPVPFTLNLVGEDNNFSLELSGNITPGIKQSMKMEADGSFSVKRPNDFLNIFGLKPLSSQLNVPSLGNLRYESTNGTDMFKSFTVRFGNAEDAVTMTGSLERVKQKKLNYNATINFNRFEYEQWKNFLSELNWKNLTDDKSADFKLKLHSEQVIYGKQKAQNVDVELVKNGHKFQIQGGSAKLAGDTLVKFDGGSVIQNDETGLVLMVAGNSGKFKDLIAQITESQKLPDTLSQSVSFKGNTTIYTDRFDVEVQELSVNKTKLTGTMAYQKTENLPQIQMKMAVENINIDDYTGYKKAKEKTDVFDLVNLTKQYVDSLEFLKKFTGSFDIDGQNVVFRGVPIGKVLLAGTVEDNILKITKLNTKDLANATLTGNAVFSGIKTDAVVVSELKADFKTPQMKLFMDKVGLMSNEKSIQDLKDFATEVVLSENGKDWTVVMNNETGDLGLTFNGQIETGAEETVYKNMQVSLSYPDFRRFSKEVFDIRGVNTALDGEFLVKMTLNGTKKDIRFSDGQIKIGPNQMTVDGSYKPGKPAKLAMNIEAPSFNVSKYIWNDLKNIKWRGMNAQKPFVFKVFDNLDHQIKISTAQLLYNNYELKNAILEWTVSGAGKNLTLKELSGTYGASNAPFKASGSLSWENTPTLILDYSGSNSEVPANLLSLKSMSFGEGKVNYKAHLEGVGSSPAEMLSHLKGNGQLTFENNVFIGTGIDKVLPLIKRTIDNRVPKNIFDKEMNRVLNSGKTAINKIDGAFTIENGLFKAMNTVLTGDGFTSNPMQIQWDIVKNTYDIFMPLTLTAYADLPPFALTIKGPENALAYQTNFVDLSASVADIIKADNTRVAKAEQDEKEQEMKIARSEREEKIRQAILDAREAVEQAGGKVKTGDNQKALYLLQNAQDALEFVNNLSIKETLTDAEYIQLTEQSRLAIMKAEEAVAEATNDKFFEDRKKLHAFTQSAKQMQSEIVRIGNTYPDIEIVQKLTPITAQYVELLNKLASEAHSNETDEEHRIQMNTARTAYMKVVKGYQYVLRFDAESNVTPITPLSLSVPQNTVPEVFEKKSDSDEDADETTEMAEATTSETKETLDLSQNSDISDSSDETEQDTEWQMLQRQADDPGRRIRRNITRASSNGLNEADHEEAVLETEENANGLYEAEYLTPKELPSTGSTLRGTITRAE